MKKLILSILSLLTLTLAGCEPVERHTETCKVLSIDKQVETNGSGESFSTDIYWLVVTDKGAFHLRTDGIWACADGVGKLKEGCTYHITVDGWFSSSFWGVYPYIVNVTPCQEKDGLNVQDSDQIELN